MKTVKSLLLISSLSLLIAFAGCKKDNTSTPDTTTQVNNLLKNYQTASKSDASLVTYHQHAQVTGIHDSCYIYWNQFRQYDSLYSLNFYEYCRSIYANNGGTNYGHDGWNWDYSHEGWDMGNWQCGLDTLQYQNWNGSGDYLQHDSQIYSWMQGYSMTGYFSSQANQCYDDMYALRETHHNNHNYHW
jgi:hypothetical protein